MIYTTDGKQAIKVVPPPRCLFYRNVRCCHWGMRPTRRFSWGWRYPASTFGYLAALFSLCTRFLPMHNPSTVVGATLFQRGIFYITEESRVTTLELSVRRNVPRERTAGTMRCLDRIRRPTQHPDQPSRFCLPPWQISVLSRGHWPTLEPATEGQRQIRGTYLWRGTSDPAVPVSPDMYSHAYTKYRSCHRIWP
ncbi:hypothetical protein VTK73DRAFT_4142 [Phialemonium thermophilum]|uniref:Uncharacterized protein n=1 Tax=Phialemonium thermophilum TaxID=223376 RepID=A0ABR3VBJ0_9PEZI